MSTSTVNTLATFKAVAKECWADVEGAILTLSVRYIILAEAKPTNATAGQLYSALPKAWQDKCSADSFGAQLSLAGRIIKAFAKAQKAGTYPAEMTAQAFVTKHGSLTKAEKVLFPAKVEPKKAADPKVGGEGNGEESDESEGGKVKVSSNDTAFSRACAIIDGMNETDLTTLSLYVADKLAKFQAKALAVKA